MCMLLEVIYINTDDRTKIIYSIFSEHILIFFTIKQFNHCTVGETLYYSRLRVHGFCNCNKIQAVSTVQINQLV